MTRRITVSRLAGLGEQQVASARYFQLKAQVQQALEQLVVWSPKLHQIQQSPFLPRELLADAAAAGATVDRLISDARSVSFIERSRDQLFVSSSEADIQAMLDRTSLAIRRSQELQRDAWRIGTRRAALAGFFGLVAVGGGLFLYARKR